MSKPADVTVPPDDPVLTANWYRSLLASRAEGVVVQTPDGRVAACNPAAERILGLTRDGMTGRTSLDPRWRAVHHDGTPYDVTDPVTAEQGLRASEERLEMVIRGADLGTWDWHVPSGRVLFNDRWATMLGYEPAEIEPHLRAWDKLLHPDDRSAVERALHEHLEGRTPVYRTEHRLRSKSGDSIWVLDIGKVLERDPAGAPVRAAGVHLDITASKRAEAERERATEELRAALARVKELEGILPTCSYCKRIRGADGQWHSIESYISRRSTARFSHTYCPVCLKEHHPEVPQE